MNKDIMVYEGHKKKEHLITLTHLNIRQSIAILLMKLVVADIILAFIIVGMYFILIKGGSYTQDVTSNGTVFLISFGLIGALKIWISIYIVLEWLNEHYEITPETVIHKRGVILRKSEKYNLDKVRAISIENSFLGELCNFATVTLYDIRLNKYLDMYLIHNPERYVRILRTLRPHLEMKTDRINLPFMPKKENLEEVED